VNSISDQLVSDNRLDMRMRVNRDHRLIGLLTDYLVVS